MNWGSRFIIVAVILSSVSLLFIALYHLISTSSGECVFSCMTLLQCITQIRWAASETVIWRSLDAPRRRVCGASVSWFQLSGFADRHPQPMIVPRLSAGQCILSCGQSSFASFHIRAVGPVVQDSRMWLIFSVTPHGAQEARWW